MRMAKRGTPGEAEAYFQRRVANIHATRPPSPCCGAKIKYISNTKNPPGWGDLQYNKNTHNNKI